MHKVNNKTYIISFLLILILSLIIFPFIFSNRLISGGDYTILTNTYLQYISHNAFSTWIDIYNFGQSSSAFLNYAPYNWLMGAASQIMHWNGIIIERIFWWLPFFILAFIAHLELKKLVPQIGTFGFLSTFIFLFNTYTLMLLGGGQISGVGLAYIVMPIILVNFIQLINQTGLDQSENLRKSIICGLLFSLQLMFDIRFAYITFVAVIIYALIKVLMKIRKENIILLIPFIFYTFIIPLGVTGLLHSFWIVPTLLFHQNPISQLGASFNSTQAVQFFSFAKFENSISLLHPNWPQNIFGEVSFMRPQFLLLPILAFSSLLFIKGKKKDELYIVYFALLALIGAFLSKGANDPFGGIYLWMFDHMPGFIMFRDPTKWYTLQIAAYSVLIPFTLYSITELAKNHIRSSFRKLVAPLFIMLFVVYICVLISPAIFGRLTGTFVSQSMPQDYQKLNTFILSHDVYSRTLWMPFKQKYGVYTLTHPAISASEYFQIYNPKDLLHKVVSRDTQKILQDASIHYIIVPDDTEGTIFLSDRKFDKNLYKTYYSSLEKVAWLKEIKGFGNNKVFQVTDVKGHFWSPDNAAHIRYVSYQPTNYTVFISHGSKGQRVVFSEAFNPLWHARVDTTVIHSQEFGRGYTSFILPKDGTYTMEVYYKPQEWIAKGLMISLAALVLISGILFILKKKEH